METSISPQEYVIGIDIGGTRLKFSLLNAANGELIQRETIPTRDGEMEHGVPAWQWAIREFVRATEVERGVAKHVGIAAPGLAAPGNQCIATMPGRLAGLEGFVWSEWMQRPVSVLNDAHAALLGEVWCGAARGMENVILLTLGTGVGGALLVNGKLHQGAIGRAGHLGHLTVDADGPKTVAGMPGGLDWMVGNATISERSGGRFDSTATLMEAVAQGDAQAAAVWDRSVYLLACGVASLINILDPEAIILGGGIATLGAPLFDALEHHLQQVEWRPNGVRVPMLPAQLGEWAGTYGAAKFAMTD